MEDSNEFTSNEFFCRSCHTNFYIEFSNEDEDELDIEYCPFCGAFGESLEEFDEEDEDDDEEE